AGGAVHSRDRTAGAHGPAECDRIRWRSSAGGGDHCLLAGPGVARAGRVERQGGAALMATMLQLRWLAHARSGDKGDAANVGLIALEPEWYELLEREVTARRVAQHFRGMVSKVVRYELPNLNALNFILHGALDGGGTLSLKTDAQGKVYSTALLRMEIPVSRAVALKARKLAQCAITS